MNLLPDHVIVHRLWPEGPDATRVACDWLFHPDTMALPDFDPEDAVALFNLVNRQDWEVCELVQAGVRSRAFRDGRCLRAAGAPHTKVQRLGYRNDE